MGDLDVTDIDAQIQALQAEKLRRIGLQNKEERQRLAEEAKILVGQSPSKPKQPNVPPALERPRQPVFPQAPTGRSTGVAGRSAPLPSIPVTQPSKLGARLAEMRKTAAQQEVVAEIPRSFSFARAPVSRDNSELQVDRTVKERAEDLTLKTNLKTGPGEFGLDPEGEHKWRAVEPNSGVRLAKRVLPHSEVQDHLYGRYFLRPSQLYSIIRLSRDGASYDIPVDGDWVTIAVVAERSEIRVSGTKTEAGDDGVGEDDSARKKQPTGKWKEKAPSRVPRKYINLKLASLGPRSGGAISGDTILQLLLFEADTVVRVPDGEGGERKSYRGGSGGAYEKWCNLAVGTVIALLNPRVLRPYKAGGGTPHPLTLPLALNPVSEETISVIGHSMDLGRCVAMQRDGNRCTTWVDTRVGTVCEYHVHAAVKRGRGTRGETASATTSYELSARPFTGGGRGKGNADYDPARKQGLQPRYGRQRAPCGPDNGGGGATYVVGHGVARIGGKSNGLPVFGEAHLSERMGRSQAQKNKRKLEEAETERVLKKVLSQGSATMGGRYLNTIRRSGSAEVQEADTASSTARVFTADAVKLIGFDPTGRRDEDKGKRVSAQDMGSVAQSVPVLAAAACMHQLMAQLAAMASLREASNRPICFRRPPGMKYSNVVVPASGSMASVSGGGAAPGGPTAGGAADEEAMVDLD